MPRHDLDPLSLVAGVLFGGLALCALLDGVGAPAGVVLPLLLIVVGVAGLLSTRARRRA